MPPNEHINLFGHLVLALIQLSHADHPEHFRQVQEEVSKVFNPTFLKRSNGPKRLPLIQLIARTYTDFLLHA